MATLIYFDTNLYYTSEGLTTAAATTSTRTMYDIGVGFSVGKSNQFQVGWNYTGHATSDSTAGVATTYTSTQMGPRFVFYFDKGLRWRTSFAYNLSTSANYTAGAAAAEKWKGTGLGADFGYQFEVNQAFSIGARLNYSTATYNESLVNGTTYSTVSYVKTFMYPSVGLNFLF